MSSPYAEDPYQPPQISAAAYRPSKDLAITQLAGTRTGLQLVYWGIVLILLAMVMLILGMIVMAMLGGPGGAGGAIGIGVGAILLVFACIVGMLMMFVGQCFCLTVPEATGAKGLVTTTVAVQVVNLLAGFGIGAASAAMGAPGEPNPVFLVVQFITGILGLVGFFCFLAFIKKVAQFIERPDLAAYAGKVIGVFASLVALYILMFGMMIVAAFGAAAGGGAFGLAAVGGCLGLVVLVVAIAGLCMYTTVLRNTAMAIGQRMEAPPADAGKPDGFSPGVSPDPFGPT